MKKIYIYTDLTSFFWFGFRWFLQKSHSGQTFATCGYSITKSNNKSIMPSKEEEEEEEGVS